MEYQSDLRVPWDGDARLPSYTEYDLVKARRTAFVSRFIVLRESKRSRAHRAIELLEWQEHTTAEELAAAIRTIFQHNGDKLGPVDRDLKRALAHGERSLHFFVREYATRATTSFVDALFDYERSNTLLFGDGEEPRVGGWQLPSELMRIKHERQRR